MGANATLKLWPVPNLTYFLSFTNVMHDTVNQISEMQWW